MLLRTTTIVASVSLFVVAAAMWVSVVNGRERDDAIRCLTCIDPGPDVAERVKSLATAPEALVALLALAAGLAVIVFHGRLRFAVAAVVALLALVTGAWLASRIVMSDALEIGPIVLPLWSVGIVLAAGALTALGASVAGWSLLPAEPLPAGPRMPPPTHQA